VALLDATTANDETLAKLSVFNTAEHRGAIFTPRRKWANKGTFIPLQYRWVEFVRLKMFGLTLIVLMNF
jgi:hypothetical protein